MANTHPCPGFTFPPVFNSDLSITLTCTLAVFENVTLEKTAGRKTVIPNLRQFSGLGFSAVMRIRESQGERISANPTVTRKPS